MVVSEYLRQLSPVWWCSSGGVGVKKTPLSVSRKRLRRLWFVFSALFWGCCPCRSGNNHKTYRTTTNNNGDNPHRTIEASPELTVHCSMDLRKSGKFGGITQSKHRTAAEKGCVRTHIYIGHLLDPPKKTELSLFPGHEQVYTYVLVSRAVKLLRFSCVSLCSIKWARGRDCFSCAWCPPSPHFPCTLSSRRWSRCLRSTRSARRTSTSPFPTLGRSTTPCAPHP